MGSLPSIGQTVFGDLNIGRTDSASTEPFFSVAIDVVGTFDRLVVVDASGGSTDVVDVVIGRTVVEGDCEC